MAQVEPQGLDESAVAPVVGRALPVRRFCHRRRGPVLAWAALLVFLSLTLIGISACGSSRKLESYDLEARVPARPVAWSSGKVLRHSQDLAAGPGHRTSGDARLQIMALEHFTGTTRADYDHHQAEENQRCRPGQHKPAPAVARPP